MKTRLLQVFSVLALLLTVCACGGGGGGGGGGGDTPAVGPPLNMVLTSTVVPGTSLPAGGVTTLRAYVTDADGLPVKKATVYFFTEKGSSVGANAVTDSKGVATTVLTVGTTDNSVQVTAATLPDVMNNYASSSISIPVSVTGPAASMTLTNGMLPDTSLSQGGTTIVTALVKDAAGNPVADGTSIFFSVLDSPDSSIGVLGTTDDGIATALFVAGTSGASGNITVKAQTADAKVSKTVTIPVANQAATISFVSAAPQFIPIKGAPGSNVSQLTFQVLDANGNISGTPIKVDFSLTQSLHGGERLLDASSFTSAADGTVSARVESGFVAGPVRVTASFAKAGGGLISTQGTVTVVSGPADLARFTMSQELFNQAGFLYEGLLNNFNAVLADRFGNIVEDGTAVSFISDCGRIGTNPAGDGTPFQVTTTDGKASAEFRTSNPVKPLCTIVAYTPGQESFADMDGDGVYEDGVDTCTGDIGEPFVDENNNGLYDAGELFIDAHVQGDGYTAANGECDMDTVIWGQTKLTLSSYVAGIDLEHYDSESDAWQSAPVAGLGLAHGQSMAFRFNVSDIYGSSLVSGTKVAVSSKNAGASGACSVTGGSLALVGDTDVTLVDILGPGQTYEFLLRDTSTSAVTTPQSCQIDITITPPGDITSTGNNGPVVKKSYIIDWALASGLGGDDTTPPTVTYTIPANGANQVLADADIQIVFSEPMDPLTVIPQNITLTDLTSGTTRPTYFDTSSNTSTSFTFTPVGGFTTGHDYRVTVSTGVEDLAGNNLASPYSFTFTSIGALVDAPRVIYVSPAQSATNVRRSASIVVQFSQPMDNTTVTSSNVFLDLVGGASVPLALTSSTSTTFVFDPVGVDLAASSVYRITVSANVRDSKLIPMDTEFTSTFTTGTLP